ncbi:hypothetical protein DPSP01_005244 [Paraphaeosphaeria sporulosa]
MLGLQVDGMILSVEAVPIRVGPRIATGTSSRTAVSWATSNKTVLAYRLSKVHVGRAGAVKPEEEYRKGALFDRETSSTEDPYYAIAGNVVSSPEFEDWFCRSVTAMCPRYPTAGLEKPSLSFFRALEPLAFKILGWRKRLQISAVVSLASRSFEVRVQARSAPLLRSLPQS